jgi:small subunit ribosomal protein S14
MASKGLIIKSKKKPKFKCRIIRRCPKCGRVHGTLRYFGNMCRICVREYARAGLLNGFTLK